MRARRAAPLSGRPSARGRSTRQGLRHVVGGEVRAEDGGDRTALESVVAYHRAWTGHDFESAEGDVEIRGRWCSKAKAALRPTAWEGLRGRAFRFTACHGGSVDGPGRVRNAVAGGQWLRAGLGPWLGFADVLLSDTLVEHVGPA